MRRSRSSCLNPDIADEYAAAHKFIQEAVASGRFPGFAPPGETVPPYDDGDSWRGRTVDGSWLADFLAREGATLSRGFALRGARVTGGLVLDGVNVGRSLVLEGCQLGIGPLSLASAQLGLVRLTQLECGGLSLDGAEVSGTISLSGVVVRGTTTFRGVRAALIETTGSRFLNSADALALSAESCHVAGDVFIRDARIEGFVTVVGGAIGGDLDLDGTTIHSADRESLAVERAAIGGGVFFGRHFSSSGVVSFAHADIGGGADFATASLLAPDDSLVLDGARIAGRMRLASGFTARGTVRFEGCRVGGLVDEEVCWPPRIAIDGFTYERLLGDDRGWRVRREWLRRQVTPSPQGYIELARVYRATGMERDARKILIERHNALLKPPDHWRNQLPTGLKAFLWRAWRWMLRLTIGHGYEPYRLAAFAVPLLAFMTLAFAGARHDDVLKPTGPTSVIASRCTTDYPCVQPFVYALDTLLPIIDFGQAEKWTPDQSRNPGKTLAICTWITIAAGWVFATLLVASFTQVVRRE